MDSKQYVATSCPVCLEDFTPPGSGSDTQPSAPPAPAAPSDSERSHLLADAGSSSPEPDDSADASSSKPSSTGAGASSSGGGAARPSAGASASPPAAKAPVYLACGHGFCEPCLKKWLKTNSTCPICRKDVLGGDAAAQPSADEAPRPPPGTQRPDAEPWYRGYGDRSPPSWRHGGGRGCAAGGMVQRHMDDLLTMELMFRLSSLQVSRAEWIASLYVFA